MRRIEFPAWPRILLYFVPIVLISTLLFFYKYSERFDDLYLNLISELLGIIFTVIVIDQLIKYEEKKRTRPARYAAARCAFKIYGKILGLMHEIVRSGYIHETQKHILLDTNVNFLDSKIGDIFSTLNLESKAPVTPSRPWEVHLSQRINEIEDLINKALQRYANFMEPDLIDILETLEINSFFSIAKLQPAIKAADKELNIKRGPYFGYGANGSLVDFLEKFKNLGLHLTNHRNEFKGLKHIPDEFNIYSREVLDDIYNKAVSKN